MDASDLNPAVDLCPPVEDLAALLAGTLPAEALEAVAAHLEVCTRCSATLEALPPDTDPLVAGLRTPLPANLPDDPEGSQAAALVEALGARLPAPVPDTTTSTPAPGGTAAYGTPAPGQLGQYELLEKLGAGGMGEVFKARHRLMHRPVALKIIHGQRLERPALLQRFQREIRALARLDHPNIVRAEYADEVGGRHFLVMEYVPGRNLACLVKERGPLPVAQACDYLRQAALALQHAHERGMVHRDVKPSNLLVTPEGQVKLLDLGLALVRAEQPAGELTATGQFMGTYDYMAPEQWDNTHTVDIRADLYSLGCTLYFLLAGRPPFGDPEHASVTRKMRGHTTEPVPGIRQFRPNVPDALEALLRRLLAKAPADRYATPAEVAAGLEPFAALPQEPARHLSPAPVPAARPPTSAPAALPPPRRPRRFRRVGVPLALVALFLATGTLVMHGLERFVQAPGVEHAAAPRVEHAAAPQPGSADAPPSESPAFLPREANVPVPLRILSLKISHFRGDPPVILGDLGVKSQGVREADDLKVQAEFGAPAFCYLIAFNPNGTEQLCHPGKETERPAQTNVLTYPRHAVEYFPCIDGTGLQAFVVVASRQPLPAYREWRQRVGAVPWKRLAVERAGGVWQSDGQRITLVDSTRRGAERMRGLVLPPAALFGRDPQAGLAGVPWGACVLVARDGPVRRLEELCQFLATRPGVEAIQAVAFPVRPKE
jgi:serine/threonine protein kinase